MWAAGPSSAPESLETCCWLQRPTLFYNGAQNPRTPAPSAFSWLKTAASPPLQPTPALRATPAALPQHSGNQRPCPHVSRETEERGTGGGVLHLHLPRAPPHTHTPQARLRRERSSNCLYEACLCCCLHEHRTFWKGPQQAGGRSALVGSEGRGEAFSSFPDSRKCGLWLMITLRVCFSSCDTRRSIYSAFTLTSFDLFCNFRRLGAIS